MNCIYINLNKTIIFLVFFLIISCNIKKKEKERNSSKIDTLIEKLENSLDNEILVVAHRGDWRNAPENSLLAIKSAIEMGVDIVEIDVRETKDGKLVLMHDRTINRTTSGIGKIKDWSLDSLKTLRLRDGAGVVTKHKIPTLEEALLLAKGKVLLNLDKSYPIIDKCYEIAQKTGTTKQIIVKGKMPFTKLKEDFNEYLDKLYYMPIINLPNPDATGIVDKYLKNLMPVAFEFTVPSDTIKMLKNFKSIRKKGASIWVNSLWARHNSGHDDEEAIYNIRTYDWYIDNGIDIIQTDRPQLLLTYLRERGLHQ